MREYEVNGTRLSIIDEGFGDAVVLLHAFPLSSAQWYAQIAALRGEFRVIAPDLRGFGGSALNTAKATPDLMAQDVLALLDQLKVRHAALVGLSMGGYVALALYKRAKERVIGLALCDTKAAADTAEAKSTRETNAKDTEAQGTKVLVERMLPKLVAVDCEPRVRREAEGMILAASRSGAAAALRGMAAREDLSAMLPSISCPALVLCGEKDESTPVAVHDAMAKAIPRSVLEVIPRAGHFSNLENPEAFTAAVRRFLHLADHPPA